MEKDTFKIQIQEVVNMDRDSVKILTHPDNVEMLALMLNKLHKEIHGEEK